MNDVINGIDWNLDLTTLPPDAAGQPCTGVWVSNGELQYRYGWPETNEPKLD